MDIFTIVKRAWEMVRANKTLWWLGILAGGAGGGNYFSNFPTPNSKEDLPSGFAEFYSTPDWSPETVQQWVNNHGVLLAVIVITAVLLVLFCIWLSLSSQVALIKAAEELESGKPSRRFMEYFRTGTPYAFRNFKLGLLVALIVLATMAIVSAIGFAGYFVFKDAAAVVIGLAITLFVLLCIAAFIWIVILGLSFNLALREMVLNETGVMQSMRAGWSLTRSNLGHVVIGYLVSIGCAFLFMLVLGFGLVALILAFVAIGFIAHAALAKAGVIITVIIGGLITLIAVTVFSGMFSAFLSVYWTLIYRALKYLSINPAK